MTPTTLFLINCIRKWQYERHPYDISIFVCSLLALLFLVMNRTFPDFLPVYSGNDVKNVNEDISIIT